MPRRVASGPVFLAFLAFLVFLAFLAFLPVAPPQAGEGAASGGAPPAADGSDWPRFLGPTGDGKSPETAIRFDWGPGGPPVVFRKAIGETYSMPVVAAGRLFLFDRRGDRERLTCMDARTGAEIWHAEAATAYEDTYGFGNGPRASPVVDGERVYTFGAEGRLRCHAASDGRVLWEADTTTRFGVKQNFFGVGASPIVEGPLLIVAVGGSPPQTDGGRRDGAGGSAIVAFDKLTGELRYASGDDQAAYASPVVATIDGRRSGLLFARGGLLGFDPATGAIDFRFPWRAERYESVNAANPVVVGDAVLVSEAYGPGAALLRVRRAGYDVQWKDPPGRDKSLQAHWATPIHLDGTLYGSSGEKGGSAELRALDWSTGRVLWRQPGLGRVSLLYVAGHLVVLTERGRLLLVRATPEGYRQVGAAGSEPVVRYPAWSAPILSRGILYVRGQGELVGFDLRPPPAGPGATRPRPPSTAR